MQGEDEADQGFALFREAHDDKPRVRTAALRCARPARAGRGRTAQLHASPAFEALDDARDVLPRALELAGDGPFVLRAVVEQRGQEAKLEGGEAEGGELAAHLLGEVLGGLAEVDVGGESPFRPAFRGDIAVRNAAAAPAKGRNGPRMMTHDTSLHGPPWASMGLDLQRG